MLKQLPNPWIRSSLLLFQQQSATFNRESRRIDSPTASLKLERRNGRISLKYKARKRSRMMEDEDEEEDAYGYNEEIALLEMYSQSARDEVLIVNAVVDGEEVEVIIFKGFSSCLSYKTSSDLSRSVIPARAVIKSIDRVKGPLDPSNVVYLEKHLSINNFKNRLQPK